MVGMETCAFPVQRRRLDGLNGVGVHVLGFDLLPRGG